MKITSTLALRYFKKNKKRSFFTICAVIVTTILVTTILILLSSYQEYMINIVRSKKNWEAEITNLKFQDALVIEKDENIKEIAFYEKKGVTDEDFGITFEDGTHFTEKINIRAYDENALKSSNIDLIEGRFPEDENEIIISLSGKYRSIINLNEEKELTINGKKQKYKVVGIAKSLEFDKNSFSYKETGAITYFDDKKADSDTIVDVTILTYKIQKIYDTMNKLKNILNIKDKQEAEQVLSEQEIIDDLFNDNKVNEYGDNGVEANYNTELLKYACITEKDSSFGKAMMIIGSFAVFIIMTVSIVVIYTSFKMTYLERIKAFGMLSSLGMSKKQRKDMIIQEIKLFGVIGIPIGILLGLVITNMLIHLINILMSKTLDDRFSLFVIDSGVEFYIKIPIIMLFIIIIVTYIIILISSILPMVKINKISQIDAIRNIVNTKIKRKQIRSPKIIERIFRMNGVLAYRNIRKEKTRYKTIIISLTMSIVLFLSVSGVIENLYASNTQKKEYNDYEIMVSNDEKINELIDNLEANKLINKYYISKLLTSTLILEVEDEKLTDEVKKLLESGVYERKENGLFDIGVNTYKFSDNVYNAILEKAGVTELKDDEVIILNTISAKTKYGEILQ